MDADDNAKKSSSSLWKSPTPFAFEAWGGGCFVILFVDRDTDEKRRELLFLMLMLCDGKSPLMESELHNITATFRRAN